MSGQHDVVRVYLDSCAIQRPLDTYTHTRIVLEAEAVLGILSLAEAGNVELISSEALEYDTEQNPWPVRREHARAILEKAHTVATVSDAVGKRSRELAKFGVKPLDALHLALAEAAGVDYFCTCDDRLLRRIQQIQGLGVKAVSPVELTQELEP